MLFVVLVDRVRVIEMFWFRLVFWKGFVKVDRLGGSFLFLCLLDIVSFFCVRLVSVTVLILFLGFDLIWIVGFFLSFNGIDLTVIGCRIGIRGEDLSLVVEVGFMGFNMGNFLFKSLNLCSGEEEEIIV